MSKTTWSCHHSRSRNARALSPSQSWAISATLRVPSMASNRRFSLASIGRKMSPQACVRLMKRADPCSPPAAAGLPELRRWEHRLAVLQGQTVQPFASSVSRTQPQGCGAKIRQPGRGKDRGQLAATRRVERDEARQADARQRRPQAQRAPGRAGARWPCHSRHASSGGSL